MGAQPGDAVQHHRLGGAGALPAIAALHSPHTRHPHGAQPQATSLNPTAVLTSLFPPRTKQDGKVLIWTQQDLNGPWASKVLSDFKVAVWRVSWSVFGNILAVSDGNNAVTLWKEATDGAR